jgi:hypothetical protein
MSGEMDMRTQVLLSLQRALWDMVTNDLLAVAVGWSDNVIRVRFVYDDQITENQRRVVSEVEAYVLADLPAGTVTEFRAARRVGYSSNRLEPNEEWWAFRRRGA